MVRYSRYVSNRLSYPDPMESEMEFINFLLKLGKQLVEKSVVITTKDVEVLALSRYKAELEQFYFLPLPSFDVVRKLVDKKRFYRLLNEMSVRTPRTYSPVDISELRLIGREMAFPYIIKPAYSRAFRRQFNAKSFVISSREELEQAIKKLSSKNLEVVIQEIVPGKEIYMFYTYLNKKNRTYRNLWL